MSAFSESSATDERASEPGSASKSAGLNETVQTLAGILRDPPISEDFHSGEIDVVIEIGCGSRAKYELNKETGRLEVDRFISVAFPFSYGCVLGSLCEDGDPLDIVVLAPNKLQPGCQIRCRPVGVLSMTVVVVPVSRVSRLYDHIDELTDPSLAQPVREIIHFFSHYRNLECDLGTWVKIDPEIGSREAAIAEIQKSLVRYALEQQTKTGRESKHEM